ncbi:mannose-P-dolichol utilization defect 1 protein homolog [Orussus abietinus]|uniref:mannose-P-dolichol utilization defect 1 protein homolog n=1 Tax=Orussus abietinus TaxID=222816 RepID=UPI0006259941|nr:mannose-P-dolichol utilization defect 1 protein homolog [Orussus abietinus]
MEVMRESLVDKVPDFRLFLFTKECLQEYFNDYNFFHVECFKATLSKALGVGIIFGSLLVKVPQIIKIANNKSGEGISLFSVLMDLFAITSMVSYSFVSGFPFSSWGDGVFLGLQTVAIAVLVLHYAGETYKALAFVAMYIAVSFATTSGAVSLKILWTCQTLNIPIILISKFAQAYTNYRNGSTGQLSAITGFLLFGGSLARIFTSIQETGDTSVIIMYICATAANAVIAAQILYYWNVDKKDEKKKK